MGSIRNRNIKFDKNYIFPADWEKLQNCHRLLRCYFYAMRF